MSSALDMSLDDIIKTNKKSAAPNLRPRKRDSGSGPSRRVPNRRPNRPAPYFGQERVEAPEATWPHEKLPNEAAVSTAGYPGRASAVETGTKLYVSNLDYGVSNEDIKELFSELGDLKQYSIHYDRIGRSKGVAEVVFSRQADALAAVQRYNNVKLDGKPMKIYIVTPAAATVPVPPAANGVQGVQNGASGSSQRRGGASGQPPGGGGSRNGGRRRPRRGKEKSGANGVKVSAEDLDAELEKYHAEAMQLS